MTFGLSHTLGSAFICCMDMGSGRSMSNLPREMCRGPFLGTACVGPPTSTLPCG